MLGTIITVLIAGTVVWLFIRRNQKKAKKIEEGAKKLIDAIEKKLKA